MPNAYATCPDVTIANGATTSTVVKAREVYEDADAFSLFAPAALDAVAFTIEVAFDAVTPTWVTLNDGVNDVAPPAAGKSSIYPAPAFACFRIKAATPVAANRTWKMAKLFNYGSY